MAFGQGTTGLIVAAVIALTSGLAFVICLREFFREVLGDFSASRSFASNSARSFASTNRLLMKNRDILLDDERSKTFVVSDSVFEQIIARRADAVDAAASGKASSEWNDRFSYVLTVSFLGLVSLAGFLAGISHFS